MRWLFCPALSVFMVPFLTVASAYARIGDFAGYSGLPTISIAARDSDERRRLYQPPGWEAHGMHLDVGVHETFLWDSNPQARSGSADGVAHLVTAIDAKVRAGPEAWQLTSGGELEYVQPMSSSMDPWLNAGVYTSLTGKAWDRSWLSGDLSVRRRHETPGDPALSRAAAEPVAVDRYKGETRLLIRRSRAFSMVGVAWQRDDYHDSILTDGRVFEQDDRDRHELRMQHRSGISPVDELDFFIGEDHRYSVNDVRQPYGLEFGFSEHRRFVGVGLDISERLLAEVTAGRARVTWLSPVFTPVERSVRSASFAFAPGPLTTVSGRYEHKVREGAFYGWAGALSKEATLGVRHELLRNLEVGLRVSRETSDWQAASWVAGIGRRRDVLKSVEAEVRFAFGPHWYLSLDARQDDHASSMPEFGYRRARLSTRIGVQL